MENKSWREEAQAGITAWTFGFRSESKLKLEEFRHNSSPRMEELGLHWFPRDPLPDGELVFFCRPENIWGVAVIAYPPVALTPEIESELLAMSKTLE